MLGCLESAQLRVSRGGRVIWLTLPAVSDAINASWNRVADEISTATFTTSLADDSCCPPPIHAKADLVEYIRNGVVEWAGQIQRFTEDGSGVTIEAFDLLGMYQRRIVHADIALVGAELTAQIDAVRTDADSVKPIPLIWTPITTGISTDLSIAASDVRVAWDAMRDIASKGLDITAVGGRVFYGDLTLIPLPPLVLNSQVIRGTPTLGEAGEGTATRVIVTDGSGTVATYPPGPPTVDARYGLEEIVIEATEITDVAVLQQIAQAEWEQRTRVPRFIAFSEGAWLDDDFPAALREIIPGRVVRVDVRGECGTIQQEMRISQLTYRVDAGTEQIRIEAAPIGTEFQTEPT